MTVTRLIETSVLVDFLRGYSPARSWIDSLPEGDAAISVVTAAELLAGCRNRREQKAVEDELAGYPTIWDSEATSQLALDGIASFISAMASDFSIVSLAPPPISTPSCCARSTISIFVRFQTSASSNPTDSERTASRRKEGRSDVPRPSVTLLPSRESTQ